MAAVWAFLAGAWALAKTVPWYFWAMGLCFMLGGCTCHAIHRATPEFVVKLP